MYPVVLFPFRASPSRVFLSPDVCACAGAPIDERDDVRRLVSAVAAAGVVAAGILATPSAVAAPGPAKQAAAASIAWGPCSSDTLKQAGAECGMLSVPLDYDHPNGEKIQLAVSRVRHTVADAQYQGVMLVNPGGPGGSGLDLSTLGQYVPNGAGDAYDWIGFDPRGVGSSVPSLTCDGNYFSYDRPFYVPVTPGLEYKWLRMSKDYAKDCKQNGALLQHIKTTDSAKDMESIRTALGADKINYYGFSYGTYLGQVYSTLFPDRVRRMVLDGNVDPRDVWYKANLNQDVAFNRNIKIYFDWIARYDSVYHLGATEQKVERLFYRTQAKLIGHPAGGIIGPDEWTDVFLSAGYYVFGWEDVANAFAAYIHDGDYSQLKDLYDSANPPGDDNGYAVYDAVQCTDVQWPTNWNRWRLDNWRTHFRAPFETWGNAWFNAPCVFWPAKAGHPVQVDGSKVPGILLINETLDAATPFEGALEVRSRYPQSSLVEGVGGTTHAGSLFGDVCVDDTIADYLATGALPARQPGRQSDKQCDPLPQPTPSAAASTKAAPKSVHGTPVMTPQKRMQLFGTVK